MPLVNYNRNCNTCLKNRIFGYVRSIIWNYRLGKFLKIRKNTKKQF